MGNQATGKVLCIDWPYRNGALQNRRPQVDTKSRQTQPPNSMLIFILVSSAIFVMTSTSFDSLPVPQPLIATSYDAAAKGRGLDQA